MKAGGEPQPIGFYFPAAYPDLTIEFAKIRPGYPKDVMDFVSRWGLLDEQRCPVHHTAPNWEHLRGSSSHRYVCWKHAKIVGKLFSILKVLERIEAGDLDEITVIGLGLPKKEWEVPTHRLMGYVWDLAAVAGIEQEVKSSYRMEPVDRARDAMCRVVSKNLAGKLILASAQSDVIQDLGRPYFPDEPLSRPRHWSFDRQDSETGMMLEYEWYCLLDVIYLHVATLMAGASGIGICEGCGSFFRRTGARQRFCPMPEDKPEVGRKRVRAVSLCATRARVAKYRLTKKGGTK